jgi:hypothetical protein
MNNAFPSWHRPGDRTQAVRTGKAFVFFGVAMAIDVLERERKLAELEDIQMRIHQDIQQKELLKKKFVFLMSAEGFPVCGYDFEFVDLHKEEKDELIGLLDNELGRLFSRLEDVIDYRHDLMDNGTSESNCAMPFGQDADDGDERPKDWLRQDIVEACVKKAIPLAELTPAKVTEKILPILPANSKNRESVLSTVKKLKKDIASGIIEWPPE